MYHAIVKRIALKNFLRVNRKDYTPILKGCSPDIHHRFGGHHALGGERHDREALRRWFERLGRLAPTLQLTVHDLWVKGGSTWSVSLGVKTSETTYWSFCLQARQYLLPAVSSTTECLVSSVLRRHLKFHPDERLDSLHAG